MNAYENITSTSDTFLDDISISNSSDETSSSVVNDNNNPLWYCHNDTSGPNLPAWELSKTIVYWVEGFSLTATSVVGILGNLVTCIVLKKLGRLKSNVFNQVILCFLPLKWDTIPFVFYTPSYFTPFLIFSTSISLSLNLSFFTASTFTLYLFCTNMDPLLDLFNQKRNI